MAPLVSLLQPIVSEDEWDPDIVFDSRDKSIRISQETLPTQSDNITEIARDVLSEGVVLSGTVVSSGRAYQKKRDSGEIDSIEVPDSQNVGFLAKYKLSYSVYIRWTRDVLYEISSPFTYTDIKTSDSGIFWYGVTQSSDASEYDFWSAMLSRNASLSVGFCEEFLEYMRDMISSVLPRKGSSAK